MISAIIVAGGKGLRMGAGFNKAFIKIGDKTVIERTVEVFEKCNNIDEIIIVTSETDKKQMTDLIGCIYRKVTHITEGGILRSDSVYNGLRKVSGDIVLIHDAARCLVTEKEIENVISDVIKYGAAAIGVTVKDTLKTVNESGNIISTVDREKTVQIQTPQAFFTKEILSLHAKAKEDNLTVTDDCSVFEHYGKTVHFTKGSYDNIKLTTPEDIEIGKQILRRRNLL